MMEHVAEQKKWGESMRRRTDGILQGYMRDLEEGTDDEADIQALDEYLSQEQAMETELLEHMDAEMPSQQQNGTMSQDPGSSFNDDEYEGLFMNLADQTALSQDMDMSS